MSDCGAIRDIHANHKLVETAAEASAGEASALWDEHCASCHGDDGRSDTPIGRVMKAPPLTPELATAEAVEAAVRRNDKHASIPPLDDAALAAITRHLQSLVGAP